MIALEDPRFFVAIIHDANTSVKRTADARYNSRPPEQARTLLGDDLGFYQDLAGGSDNQRNAVRGTTVKPDERRKPYFSAPTSTNDAQKYG